MRAVLVLLLCLASSFARADYPATMVWVFGNQASPPKYYDADPQTACSKYAAGWYGTGWTCKRLVANSTWYQGDMFTPSGSYNNTVQSTLYGLCPYGGSLNGTTCKGADEPKPCADTKDTIRKFYYTNGGPYTAPTNYNGCHIVAKQLLTCRTDASGTYCMWMFNRDNAVYSGPTVANNGSAPTDTSDEVKTDPQTNSPPIRNPDSKPDICPTCIPCPQGSVQAGIDSDGVPLCVGSGTRPPDAPKTPTTTTKPSTSTTDSSGTVTTIQDTVQQNSDGSTTTTTTTTVTKADGTKTTSVNAVTSNTASGQPGKTDSAADQSNFCKQNPLLAVCRNSSVSGSCGTLACNGDAIQCATLAAAQKLQCARQSDEDTLKAMPAKAVGEAILSGDDPQKASIDTLVKGDTVDMSKTSLDQSGFIGGGSCFADKVFTVMGRPVTLSFTSMCNNIQPLRYVIMACAFLVAYLMVARSVIQT